MASEEEKASLLETKLKQCHNITSATYEQFMDNVFTELRASEFKRLSFLSDMLATWDLSHLTGYPAILASAGLCLRRKTYEIDFYEDLFKQLDKDKLIHFLAWAVISNELDEKVLDKITSKCVDDNIKMF